MVQAQYRRLAVPLLVSMRVIGAAFVMSINIRCRLRIVCPAPTAAVSPLLLLQEGAPSEAIVEKKRQKRAQLRSEKMRLKYSINNYDKVGAGGTGQKGRAWGVSGCRWLRLLGSATARGAQAGSGVARSTGLFAGPLNARHADAPSQIHNLPKNVTY